MSSRKHDATIVAKVVARERWRFWRRSVAFWTVQVARNGEILYTSEIYTTREKRDQTGRQVASQLDVEYVIE